MKAPVLESQRLILRPLGLDHLSERYVQWLNDPEVIRYMDSGGDYDLKKLKVFLTENEKKEILFWAIHLKSSDKHVGNIKIDPIDEKRNTGEIGIMMGDRTEWGKGYAKEASITVFDYCFEVIKLSGITMGVVDKNVASFKLYSKIGFTIQETIQEAGVYDGEVCSCIRMRLHNERQ